MKHNKIVFLCGIVSFFLSVGNLLVSFFTKQLIDAPSFEIVVKLGMVWLTSVLINLTKNYMVQRHYLKKQKNYMCVLLKGIFSFPFCFLESKQYNEDLNRVKGLVSYEQSFVSSIEGITTAGCGIIGLYVLLFNQVSALILFFLSIFLVIIIIISVSINRKLSVLMYDYWKNYIENTRKYNYISSVLSNKEYVEEKKVYSYLPFFSCEFNKEFDFASKKNRALGSRRIKLELLSDTIFLIYSLIGFLILLYAFIECEISIGLFISSTGYLLSLLGSISNAIGSLENIVKYKKIRADSESFLKHKDNEIKDSCDDLICSNAVLSIKNLKFKYPTTKKMILDTVSFTFQRGKKYAIVGVNGCGKTTLAKIISGLYDPLSGSISYTNMPVVLFQDFNKYPATLRENIILSDNICMQDEGKLIDVENNSGLKKKIAAMKLGDATNLTTLKEGGEDLSGGEWQRVALARILWCNADVYILDEPTASLDPLEEIRIFKIYNKMLENKTVIFITHRLGFVKNVDEIIVLNDGKIKETGTHEDLLNRPNGLYKRMFEEQRSWYE